MTDKIIRPKAQSSSLPASPIPGYTCQNCPGFTGSDINNLTTGMGRCRFEPAKMLGANSQTGAIMVEWTPTHPDWWCMQHPMIKAIINMSAQQQALNIVSNALQPFIGERKE